ncbi:DUF4157 domain-containing protein [Candidatus Acetothermia bacterium]|nr:DUF4157 domain-containing protein [Candidatus Acetothermia bacterium]
MYLQRTIGNQAVLRLLESGALQPKLRINQPGDIYEQEADRVAEQVTASPQAPTLQRKCACGQHAVVGGECEECKKKREATTLQRAATSAASVNTAPPIVQKALRSPGQPLDASTRALMESRLGYDFSEVRMHTDARAAESARALNAHAYTVGRNIVFGAGQYAPDTRRGTQLLAHELAHVLQSAAVTRIARKADEKEEEDKKKATEGTGSKAEATSASGTAPQDGAVSATVVPTVTPGGHTPAPPGVALCPDAPPRNIVVVGCTTTPSPTLPVAEKAILPLPSAGRFGGDVDRAKFAKELAQCRASREVKDEIEKRYSKDVATAKKRATEEAKKDTETAIKAATEGLDPQDKGTISRAKTRAAADAKKAAAKKIAEAQAAVTREDVATVTAELATKYEDDLAADYDNTIRGALVRYGAWWLRIMQAKLDSERKRITKEKSAKPKVTKGDTPPVKSTEEIAAEVEADMVEVRCKQEEWARNQLEAISHAWAVGRREQIDFLTIPQKAAYLKDFKPTYEVAISDRIEIPTSLQAEKNMPGVAPEMADFLSHLAADPNTPAFKASNYSGHGGGSWAGKGFSTDLSLTATRDQRGFWEHSTAVRFLLAIDATAKALGARWRVLYNDFGVAQEVNQITSSRNVEFIGHSEGGKLNWHGPDPLILHFHLDLEIPQNKPTP